MCYDNLKLPTIPIIAIDRKIWHNTRAINRRDFEIIGTFRPKTRSLYNELALSALFFINFGSIDV